MQRVILPENKLNATNTRERKKKPFNSVYIFDFYVRVNIPH